MLTQPTTVDLPPMQSSNWNACLSEPEIELRRLRAEKARRYLHEFVMQAGLCWSRPRLSGTAFTCVPFAAICRPSRRGVSAI
jgi:hypothetical protein